MSNESEFVVPDNEDDAILALIASSRDALDVIREAHEGIQHAVDVLKSARFEGMTAEHFAKHEEARVQVESHYFALLSLAVDRDLAVPKWEGDSFHWDEVAQGYVKR